MTKTLLLAGVALVALVGLPQQAAAAPITTNVDLNTVFTGYTPDGSAPWLTAQFTSSTGSTTGTLVLSSNTGGADFVQGLNSKKSTIGWAFYLDQAVSGVICSTGKCADNNAFYSASGLNTASVPGLFNLGFGWSSGNRFMDGDTVTYDLTFLNPLMANPFVENDSGWSSVAHVQGIGTGGCSGWIVAGGGTGAKGGDVCPGTKIPQPPPVTVPEPGTLGMFGLGLLFAGLLLGSRRRYS